MTDAIKTVDEIKAELDEVRAKKQEAKPSRDKVDWYGFVYCDPAGYASVADFDGGTWLGKTEEIIPYLRKHGINGDNVDTVLLAVQDFWAEKKQGVSEGDSGGLRVSKSPSCHLALQNDATHIIDHPQTPHRATFSKKALKNDTELSGFLKSLVDEGLGIPTIYRKVTDRGHMIPYRTLGRWIAEIRQGGLL